MAGRNYCNYIYNKKLYKIASRKAIKQNSSTENGNNKFADITEENTFKPKDLINVSKAYKLYEQRMINEAQEDCERISKERLNKKIQRSWLYAKENPLNIPEINDSINQYKNESKKNNENIKYKNLRRINPVPRIIKRKNVNKGNDINQMIKKYENY